MGACKPEGATCPRWRHEAERGNSLDLQPRLPGYLWMIWLVFCPLHWEPPLVSVVSCAQIATVATRRGRPCPERGSGMEAILQRRPVPETVGHPVREAGQAMGGPSRGVAPDTWCRVCLVGHRRGGTHSFSAGGRPIAVALACTQPTAVGETARMASRDIGDHPTPLVRQRNGLDRTERQCDIGSVHRAMDAVFSRDPVGAPGLQVRV